MNCVNNLNEFLKIKLYGLWSLCIDFKQRPTGNGRMNDSKN
jgi:hypothetical protein